MFISVIGISLLVHYFCSNTIVVYYALQIVYTNCHLLWIMTLIVFTNQRAELMHEMQQNGVQFVLNMVCLSCSP